MLRLFLYDLLYFTLALLEIMKVGKRALPEWCTRILSVERAVGVFSIMLLQSVGGERLKMLPLRATGDIAMCSNIRWNFEYTRTGCSSFRSCLAVAICISECGCHTEEV